MLDIRFIRENTELVKKSSERKGYKVDVDKLLELDKNRRGLLGEIEKVRAERNELADKQKAGKPDAQSVEQGKKLKDSLAQLENQLSPLDGEYDKLLREV